jgi:PAS domain S-box-containing protein
MGSSRRGTGTKAAEPTKQRAGQLAVGLARCEEGFHTSMDTVIDPFVLLRPVRRESGEIVDFFYEYANDAACEANVLAREELLGMRMLDRSTQLAPVGLFAAYAAVIETGQPLALDDFAQPNRRGGESGRRFFDVRALRAGELLVLTWREVTERDRDQAERARLDEIVSSSDDAIVSHDGKLRITTWNSGAEAVYGYTPEEVLGESHDVLIPADATLESRGLLEQTACGGKVQGYETQRLHKDGTVIDVAITAFAENDAVQDTGGVTTITRDISASKAQAAELRSSEHFLSALTHSMAEGMFSFDRDEHVTYMNQAAEQLLGWTMKDLGPRSMHDTIHYQREDGSPYAAADCPLFDALRTGTTVRVEDDTFTRRDGRLLPVSYSAAPIMVDEKVEGMVVVFGDVSARRAKEQRHRRQLETLTWVGRIRDAIDEDRLVLHAQPIIDVHTRELVAYELLLRMVDRDGAIIAPVRFLPAAEQFGLIEEIDRWVLSEAVKLAGRGIKVQFNISGKSLGSRELIGDLVRGLRETGAALGLLVCEITETALATDETVAEAFVHELRELGCEIALDDFGVGYGGFSYLKRLPITVLKIDIQFVRDLLESPQNQHVVKAIVNLAQGFGRQTIAEGVENQATLELLKEFGVDYAQGFAIGRPVPIHTLFATGTALL